MLLDALEQLQPAVIKALNGFNRHCVVAGTGHAAQLRGRPNIDRQLVVRHGRAVAAQDFFVNAVNAHYLVFEQPCTCKHAQARQIDMYLVIVVVPSHVARQHARVRGVHVGTNERKANAGDRLHTKAFEHAHMAVASAD